MIIVSHRRNHKSELAAVPPEFGIEVDLRSYGKDLIIHHDPFVAGESFEDWLESYRHRLLILNVKEEGLEDRLLALMADRVIKDFFFLDQSLPFLVRTVRQCERRCAVRVSEYETVETALNFGELADWIWVDCFTRFPLSRADADRLHNKGFRLCLVSPELQGRKDTGEIANLPAHMANEGITVEAVCTKTPELWK